MGEEDERERLGEEDEKERLGEEVLRVRAERAFQLVLFFVCS